MEHFLHDLLLYLPEMTVKLPDPYTLRGKCGDGGPLHIVNPGAFSSAYTDCKEMVSLLAGLGR